MKKFILGVFFLKFVLHVVFNSLTKDMTGKEDVYRGPAIRALCRITDVIYAFFIHNILTILRSHFKHGVFTVN